MQYIENERMPIIIKQTQSVKLVFYLFAVIFISINGWLIRSKRKKRTRNTLKFKNTKVNLNLIQWAVNKNLNHKRIIIPWNEYWLFLQSSWQSYQPAILRNLSLPWRKLRMQKRSLPGEIQQTAYYSSIQSPCSIPRHYPKPGAHFRSETVSTCPD